MDARDMTYVGPSTGTADGERRYRWALGGERIDVVVPETAAKVWFQVRPDAGDADLERWARERAEPIVAQRL